MSTLQNDHAGLVCGDCGKDVTPGAYASNGKGHKVCYQCCAKQDITQMRRDGRITLYLVGMPIVKINRGWVIDPSISIVNWPSTLRIAPIAHQVKVGKHNLGGKRFDVWFAFDGFVWHGFCTGDNQLLHCRKTAKRTASNPAPQTHYIGMAGLRGYMPNYCEVYETRGQAADDLGQLHELSKRRIALLRRDGYCDLDLYTHGNEYCEIVRCDCNTPGDHSEDGQFGEYGNSQTPRAPMGVKFNGEGGFYRIVG